MGCGRVRSASPRRTRPGAGAVATVVAGVLVAAVQPALLRATPSRTRAGAQVWIVVDTSNSMQASERLGAPTRFRLATSAALELRRSLGELQAGLGVMSGRVLPLLPPSGDEDTFAAVLRSAVRPNVPQPLWTEISGPQMVSTSFDRLKTLPPLNFYQGAKRGRSWC